MENMSVLQIGAKYSYRELVDDIDLSYKYRCIIKQLLLQIRKVYLYKFKTVGNSRQQRFFIY